MGTEIKGTQIGHGGPPKPKANNGGTMEDLSQSLKTETISQANFNEAANTDIRSTTAPRTGRGGTTMDYQYSDGNMIPVEKATGKAVTSPTEGKPSLFNTYAVFTHPNCDTTNDFYDTKGGAGPYPKGDRIVGTTHLGGRELNISSILADFNPKDSPSQPYYVSDFLFAKYYKRIPLNHLITLRRFAFPTYDNLEFGGKDEVKPIAQAVTFFGDPSGNNLKDITKMTGYINWEKLTANVHDVESQGQEQDISQTPFVGMAGKAGVTGLKVIGALNSPGKQDLSGRHHEEVEAQKYQNFEYTNKVLGPVNVVNETMVRQRGIGANTDYTLQFDYQMRSFNKINPRVAMLDLLCNMLALTFNNAKFWGGANRYFPQSPQFAFFGKQDLFYEGRYGDYIQDVVARLGDGLGKGLDILSSLVSGILSGNLSSMNNIAKSGANAIFDMQSRKNRPKVLGFHALLTGLPVGEWHMTVGNPYRPMLKIGNLICTGFDMHFEGHLGIDDFPNELSFEVNLKHGRPRDKGDLESMFNQGQGRMYYPPAGLVDVGNSSSATGIAQTKGSEVNSQKHGTTHIKPHGDAGELYYGNDSFNRAEVNGDVMRKMLGSVFSLIPLACMACSML